MFANFYNIVKICIRSNFHSESLASCLRGLYLASGLPDLRTSALSFRLFLCLG